MRLSPLRRKLAPSALKEDMKVSPRHFNEVLFDTSSRGDDARDMLVFDEPAKHTS